MMGVPGAPLIHPYDILCAGSWDSTLCVIQLVSAAGEASSGDESPRQLEVLTRHSFASGVAALTMLPDGHTAVVALKRGCRLRLYDTESLQVPPHYGSRGSPAGMEASIFKTMRIKCVDRQSTSTRSRAVHMRLPMATPSVVAPHLLNCLATIQTNENTLGLWVVGLHLLLDCRSVGFSWVSR